MVWISLWSLSCGHKLVLPVYLLQQMLFTPVIQYFCYWWSKHSSLCTWVHPMSTFLHLHLSFHSGFLPLLEEFLFLQTCQILHLLRGFPWCFWWSLSSCLLSPPLLCVSSSVLDTEVACALFGHIHNTWNSPSFKGCLPVVSGILQVLLLVFWIGCVTCLFVIVCPVVPFGATPIICLDDFATL